MRINNNGHKEHLDHRKIKYISFLSFIFGFTDAFFIYILSTYFAEVIDSENVGAFYLATFSLVFLLLWNLHHFLRKIGGSIRGFFLLIIGSVILSAILSTLTVGWIGAFILVLLLVITNIAWVTLDVILEEYSSDGVTGAVRGLHLTIMNTGILLAPFLSTRMLEAQGYNGIFFGMTLGYSLLLALSIILLRNGIQYSSAKMEARLAWKKMLREKNLFHIYNVSFALEFFYVIMVIYTPIFLREQGLTWDDIGIIFTIMLLPFILFQYPLGVLADKRFGEKEFLVVSVGIAAIGTLLIGIASSTSIVFWGAILFLSRVGAAGMEVLRDAYFYKQIDARDDDLIAFFRTARPVANIVAAILAIPFLAFFSLQSIFFLLVGTLLLSLFSVLAIEDTPAEIERIRQ